ncbi:hypothetical protein D9758_002440 [Tetrapyrgos nigripes]|uniref:Uncharacterized protein n=1 Tax=Tetrapyrgos nigripes TaxID=182062 RepID=A0A8H5GNI5_9AGAR|nr:hypothetical protein D9758_002440 [Tetrapyrgos nigripes]
MMWPIIDAEREKTLHEELNDKEREAIYSSLSAQYLPALVTAYKRIPKESFAISSIYTALLRNLVANGYFAKLKFMRSEIGKDLYRVHAQKIAEAADSDPRSFIVCFNYSL